MNTTAPITYRFEFAGRDILVTRTHAGTAYARNGNAHNPTEYFTWTATLDGETVTTGAPTRAEAYERARARALSIPYSPGGETWRRPATGRPYRCAVPGVNVRPWPVVKAEMKANARGQVTT